MIEIIGYVAAIAVAMLVVVGPGSGVLAAFGVRGLALWSAGPLVSVAVIAVSAALLGVVGIGWSLPSAIAALVVVLATSWAVGRVSGFRPRPRLTADGRAVLGLGLTVGSVLLAVRLLVYISAPDSISQTNDAVFHLNALRWIAESESASSWDVSGVVGGNGFYPAAWHGLASLVMLITGASIPVAANAVTIVIASVVWPLGIAWLTSVATGSRIIAGTASAIAPSLLAFPMLMTQWGILYPYSLSVALVPAALASVISFPKPPVGGTLKSAAGMRLLTVWLILVGSGFMAIALAQPSTLLTLATAAAIWSCFALMQGFRTLHLGRRMIRVTAVAVILVVFLGMWISLSSATSGSHWLAFRSVLGAAADVLLVSPVFLPPAVAIGVLCLVGAVVAARIASLRWLVAVWVVFAALYAVAATLDNVEVRTLLLGAWYADPYRIAAIGPLAAVPLAALGLVSTAAAVLRSFRHSLPEAAAERRAGWWALAGAALLSIGGLVLTPVLRFIDVSDGDVTDASTFAIGEDTYLSQDERTLLERLDSDVPPGARVIGNPSAGTGFGYALSGVDVFPRTWAQPPTEAWETIMYGLRNLADDPAVCEALHAYGDPEFVLDFGPGEQKPGRWFLPEMTGLSAAPGFELVDSEGRASLWRITGCEP
tara:strand:- start:1359 stop:3323 length:1965 start_codon:yes stop_codon:yes gene_type:complete